MGIRVECDWCRQTIPAHAPYVTVEIDGMIIRGSAGNEPESVGGPARVYCGLDRYYDDDPAAHAYTYGRDFQGHRPSCAQRVLAALNGNPEGRVDMGLEWRLVPQPAPRSSWLIEAPVDALKLQGRTLTALKKAGVTHVRQLACLTEAQWLGISGIGRGGAEEILKALHRHEKVDPKSLVPEGATA